MEIKKPTKICPECDGSGIVEVSYYSNFKREWFYFDEECPNCEGTGEVENLEEPDDVEEPQPYRDEIYFL